MGTVVTSSCWGCESEHIQGEGTERERLGHSWTSVSLRDCPNHTPVPGVVLVLCMAYLKAALTRGILQHTDAALAVLRRVRPCRIVAGPSRPTVEMTRPVASQLWWAHWICLSSLSVWYWGNENA